MKLINLLFEYSEKTIQTTIDRWKKSSSTLDDSIARQIILRFDQIKQGLDSKLDQVALPDELRSGKRYLNIDHYSLEDMVKLLKSIPESDKKIRKDAIKKFMDSERIDKGMATHYVIRFLNARKDLKYAISNGTEDGRFDRKEVNELIPRRLIQTDQVLDPRAWKFQNLEHMLDALFPYQGKVEDGGEVNTAQVNADKVYDQNGIEVYKGDAQHKCVTYNPTENGRKKYGWCIAQPGNSNYDYYRFQQGTNRMFYIIFDRNQPEENKWHAFVIHVGENGTYWATSARNDGDNRVDSWDELGKYIDSSTWNKMKGLKNVFEYIPPSKAEIQSAALRGKKLSANDFRELDYDTKKQYIQSNAGNLTQEILGVLDKALKELAINYGQKFPFSELKKTTSLAKRYAIFRFRHTNYSDEPIPLPYVQFLDDAAKKKYLDTFDDNINYDYIKQYFGDSVLNNYIEQKTKELDYIQPNYVKYIKDEQLRKFYQLYNKLTNNWSTNADFGKTNEELENSFDMPTQSIDPNPMFVSDFQKLSPGELKAILNMVRKFQGEKYATLTFALPYVLKNNGKYLFIIPNDPNDTSWSLFNSQGKKIKDIDGDSAEIGGEELSTFYPAFESYKKLFSEDEYNLGGDSLKESLKTKSLNNYLKETLMHRAGLL